MIERKYIIIGIVFTVILVIFGIITNFIGKTIFPDFWSRDFTFLIIISLILVLLYITNRKTVLFHEETKEDLLKEAMTYIEKEYKLPLIWKVMKEVGLFPLLSCNDCTDYIEIDQQRMICPHCHGSNVEIGEKEVF